MKTKSLKPNDLGLLKIKKDCNDLHVNASANRPVKFST